MSTTYDRLSRSTLAPGLMSALQAEVAGAAVVIHDPSRLEWSVTLPLPSTSSLKYSVEAEAEIPTRLYVEHRPWSHLQALARFDWPVAGPQSTLAEVDVLRREVLDVDGRLVRAAEGFRRQCLLVMRGQVAARDIETSPLSVWLEMGIAAVADSRRRILRARNDEDSLLARESVLADEFLSVRALAMLTSMTRHLEQLMSSSKGDAAKGEVARELRRAYDQELAYRGSCAFCDVNAQSPASLEAYVSRANALKKHFEALLYLRRETKHLDARIQPWIAALATLVAGAVLFQVQIVALRSSNQAVGLGSGAIVLAIVVGVLLATRDRLKLLAEQWLSSGLRRLRAQRITRLFSPFEAHHVVARAKESFEEVGLTKPDKLNPDLGVIDQATQLRFAHRGELFSPAAANGIQPRALRLIFRYDFSPLFARLDDPRKRLAVADPNSDRLQLVTASRTYRIAFRLKLKSGSTVEEQRYDLVLDKRGLLRLEAR